jgi:hypothetical protein
MSGQKSEIVLCLLPLIDSGENGLDIDALAADVIAACARFNIWFADLKDDANVGDETMMKLLDSYDEVTKECQASVRRFSDTGDRKELSRSLSQIATKLNQRL